VLPFGSALLAGRSRRHLRQSPDRETEGSTHVDTAFMGLTSLDVSRFAQATNTTTSPPNPFPQMIGSAYKLEDGR